MQQRDTGKRRLRERLTYANVMSTFAAFLALGGATAFAAEHLDKNSVGSRQLKADSVTSGKIANGAVSGSKVAKHSLTGEQIKLSALGTVPQSEAALSSANADKVNGHSALCPAGTTLINGLCYDSIPNPVASTLEEAADHCNEKGGFLPTPMELYEARGVLNLGVGGSTEHQYTDSFYGNTNQAHYSTVTVDGDGHISEQSVGVPSRYTCAYTLLR